MTQKEMEKELMDFWHKSAEEAARQFAKLVIDALKSQEQTETKYKFFLGRTRKKQSPYWDYYIAQKPDEASDSEIPMQNVNPEEIAKALDDFDPEISYSEQLFSPLRNVLVKTLAKPTIGNPDVANEQITEILRSFFISLVEQGGLSRNVNQTTKA